jgi:hypothetical protein
MCRSFHKSQIEAISTKSQYSNSKIADVALVQFQTIYDPQLSHLLSLLTSDALLPL